MTETPIEPEGTDEVVPDPTDALGPEFQQVDKESQDNWEDDSEAPVVNEDPAPEEPA